MNKFKIGDCVYINEYYGKIISYSMVNFLVNYVVQFEFWDPEINDATYIHAAMTHASFYGDYLESVSNEDYESIKKSVKFQKLLK